MNYFILLCGGKGTRMNLDAPKQYLKFNGEYIFSYSLKALKEYKTIKNLIIVADPQYFSIIEKEIPPLFKSFKLVNSGNTRQESVYNALKSIDTISSNDKILIHDSARMFINKEMIKLVFDELKIHDSSIPYKTTCNAVFSEKKGEYISNKDLKLIETPQGFNLKKLRKAYDSLENIKKFTDDGSIFLKTYNELHFIYNPFYNLKITTIDDIKEVEAHL